MRVLWVHNFNRQKNKNSGTFMYDQLDHLKNQSIEVELFYVNGKSFLEILSKFISMYKKSRQFDLIHAQYGSFVGFFTSWLPAKKKIVSLRGTDFYGAPKVSLKTKLHNKLSLFFTFNSLKRYNTIITMSDRMTIELKVSYPAKEIITLTDGMHLSRFEKYSVKKEQREPFKILFSSINKDNPIKRAHIALEAIEILKKRNFNVELIPMIGIDHDKVPEFVSKCDMVLLTSTHEGWPNIIKECLALNIPFVSTDVSDLKAIADVEDSCFVVEAVPEKIAEAIINVMNIDRITLRLKKHIEHMDMNNYVQELITIYKSLQAN